MSKPKIVGPASELMTVHSMPAVCTCCERPLKGNVAWLELDQRDDTYHDRGDVPPERSQGWFPFGITCATKLNAAARTASQ
jgi:hypothetical protein